MDWKENGNEEEKFHEMQRRNIKVSPVSNQPILYSGGNCVNACEFLRTLPDLFSAKNKQKQCRITVVYNLHGNSNFLKKAFSSGSMGVQCK